jgi:probable phosphoglycerate mutase
VLISPEVRALGREWYTHPAFADTRYGEGMKRVQRECDAFMLALGYRHDYDACAYVAERPNDERVALFAHHGFGVAFLSCLLDIPYPEMALRFDIGHSSMTVIDFTEKGGIVIPKVLQLSNDSHLWREGLPTKYQNRIYF